MKLKGLSIGEPKPRVCVIERNGVSHVFKLKAVTNSDGFDKICKEPQPPQSLKPGGKVEINYDNLEYKEALKKYYDAKTQWMILESLSATDGLEWETIDMTDPNTWGNYIKELNSAGLTNGEVTYLITEINKANSIDRDSMDQALERFMSTQEAVT